jgi:hypothetical protein
MHTDEPFSTPIPEDPEIKQLLSEIAFNDALAKLVAEAKSAEVNLQRLEVPGLGPPPALDMHRRYYQRECEKAQLRIEIFRLPREIEQLKRGYERASTPGARRHHERRCTMLEASRAVGRSSETGLPEAPELQAKKNLDSARALLEFKERRLQEITIHDDEWNALINATPAPRRLVTQAPPPPHELRGGGWVRSKPKPTELPTSFPPGFPTSLVLNARVILADVVREFPDRSKLETLCKVLVSRYTDLLCTGVCSGVIKAHEAPDELNTIVHYVLVVNCERDTERFEIRRAVVNSDEWHAMLKRLLECEADVQAADAKPTDPAKSNPTRERIDGFVQKMREHGHPISRKDIWQAARYEDATEFERFQREDPRATAGSRRQFDRILNMSPEEFIQNLNKLHSK